MMLGVLETIGVERIEIATRLGRADSDEQYHLCYGFSDWQEGSDSSA